jgi:hypothetical protein
MPQPIIQKTSAAMQKSIRVFEHDVDHVLGLGGTGFDEGKARLHEEDQEGGEQAATSYR